MMKNSDLPIRSASLPDPAQLFPLLGEILDVRELTEGGGFVTIGGVSMDVDNLLDAIQGRSFVPLLTTEEILVECAAGEDYTRASEGHYTDAYGPGKRNRKWVERRLNAARKRKAASIHRMIYAHTFRHSLDLPRRAVILAALAKMSAPIFHDLTDFILQTAAFTEESADLAVQSAREVAAVGGDTLAAVRAITPSTAVESVSSCTYAADIAAILGRDVAEIGDTPMVVFERAVTEYDFEGDDAHQFVVARGTRVHIPKNYVDILSMCGAAISGAGLFVFAFTTADGMSTADKISSIYAIGIPGLMLTAYSFFAMSTGYSVHNVVRRVAFNGAVKREQKAAMSTHRTLQTELLRMKGTALGQLKVAILREIALQHNGAAQEDPGRIAYWMQTVRELEEGSAQDEFARYCAAARADFSSSESVAQLLDEMPLFAAAELERDLVLGIEEVTGDENRPTTGRLALATT